MYNRESPSARKRQRLSSPTYDDQLGDLSQDDMRALDEIEAKLPQTVWSYANGSPASSPPRTIDFGKQGLTNSDIASNSLPQIPHLQHVESVNNDHSPFLLVDHDSAYTPGEVTDRSIQAPRASGFASALESEVHSPSLFKTASRSQEPSPSPEEPAEIDYSTWFQSDVAAPMSGFQSAALERTGSTAIPAVMPGFMKASHKGFVLPSDSALLHAKRKMKLWEEGDPPDSQPSFQLKEGLRPTSPQRKVLGSVENSSLPAAQPGIQTPTPHIPKSTTNNSSFPLLSTSDMKTTHRPKPFRTPFANPHGSRSQLASSAVPLYPSSPLNPNRSHVGAMAPRQPPISAFATPVKNLPTPTTNVPPATPARIGLTPRTKDEPSKPKFVTPFKAGVQPGQTSQDHRTLAPTAPQTCYPSAKIAPKQDQRKIDRIFDLTSPPDRMTLLSSGLVPQSYSTNELGNKGIDATELTKITPTTALYYCFHTSSATPPTQFSRAHPAPEFLGHRAAYEELIARGCSLATKEWVENHWGLILWKLAGLVALQPELEANPATKRWCWSEVMRQLFYRYERELNSGSRPPLRLLTTRDAPASSAMVLCVSNMTWSESSVDENGVATPSRPELEVTDGWYRLRARVDEPLARAVRKGNIRIGRKIAIAGAKLSSERKEPEDILEAYGSTTLVISGNSSHLAPWHSKLGFQKGPSIATLHSLTPDGGPIALLAIEIIKVYPVAYLEFIEGEGGQRRREGPRNSREEAAVLAAWQKKRESAASQLWAEHQKRISVFESYAERLERFAGAQIPASADEDPPAHIESLYDELEDHVQAKTVFARINRSDASWLARHIRERCLQDQEKIKDEIDRELESVCPPREVRDFRIIVVKDAYSSKRPKNRKAQLTVWDVLGLSLWEGREAGTFESGQKFLITNIMPTQQSAWMGYTADSEIYFSTRRDSRWTRIP